MSTRVLIAYASKYGSTAEIAERIGDVLRRSGADVTVAPAEQAGDLTPYRAVVLGSGVYAGHWLKEAVAFLEHNEAALASRPVWLFSSGPTGEGDPVDMMGGWRFPQGQQAVADRIGPRDIAVFHGNIDVDALHLGDKLIIKAVRAKGGDFRDWTAIAAWASKIAEHLGELRTA